MSAPPDDRRLASALDDADRGAPAPPGSGPPSLAALERRGRLRQVRRGGGVIAIAATGLLWAVHLRSAAPEAVGPRVTVPTVSVSPVLALASRVQERAAEGAAREVRDLYVRAAGGSRAARGDLEWLASAYTVGDEAALARALLARLDAREADAHPRDGAGVDPTPEPMGRPR